MKLRSMPIITTSTLFGFLSFGLRGRNGFVTEKDSIPKFELIFEGPSDESMRTLQKLKGAFISDLEFPISEVQRILNEAPLAVFSSESEDKVTTFYNSLKKAGAKVSIIRPKREAPEAEPALSLQTEEGEELLFDLDDITFESEKKEKPAKKKIYTLDVDDVLYNTVDSEESQESLEKAIEEVQKAVPIQQEETLEESLHLSEPIAPPTIETNDLDLELAIRELTPSTPQEISPVGLKTKPAPSFPLEEVKEKEIPETLDSEPLAPASTLSFEFEDPVLPLSPPASQSTELPPNPPPSIIEAESRPSLASELSLDLTPATEEKPYEPIYSDREQEEEFDLDIPQREIEEHTITSSSLQTAHVSLAVEEPSPIPINDPKPQLSEETEESLRKIIEKKKSSATQEVTAPPLVDDISDVPRDKQKMVLDRAFFREYGIPALIGLVIIIIANILYFNFKDLVYENSPLVTSDILPANSDSDASPDQHIEHVAPIPTEKFFGESYREGRSFIAKGDLRLQDDSIDVQTFSVRLQLPPPPDPTPEEIVQGKIRDPWITRIDFDYVAQAGRASEKQNEIQGPVRITIDDKREKNRIIGHAIVQFRKIGPAKVALSFVGGTLPLNLADSEVIPPRRNPTGYERLVKGGIQIELQKGL